MSLLKTVLSFLAKNHFLQRHSFLQRQANALKETSFFKDNLFFQRKALSLKTFHTFKIKIQPNFRCKVLGCNLICSMRKQYPVPPAYKFLKSQTRLHISQELIHQVFHKLKLHHILRFALCYSPLKP